MPLNIQKPSVTENTDQLPMATHTPDANVRIRVSTSQTVRFFALACSGAESSIDAPFDLRLRELANLASGRNGM